MNLPHWLWALWLGGCFLMLVWFGIMEGIALVNQAPGDTLTEVVRSLHVPAVVWFLFFGAIISTALWALAHFTIGDGLDI